MDSPRSVTSEMSESRTRLPASIANASKEDLQRKLVEALKALKSRDKKLQQLVTVSENLSAQKDSPGVSGSSNTKDELEVVRNQNESLNEQVQKLSLSKQKNEAELETLRTKIKEGSQAQDDLRKAVEAAELSLRNEVDRSQPLQEQVDSLKAAIESMSIEREQAFEKLGEEKEHSAMLEGALADAQVKIRQQSSSLTELGDKLNSHQTQVTELESKVRKLSQEKEETEDKLSTLKEEVVALNAKSDADSEEIARLSDQWGKKVSDLEKELETVRSELEKEIDAHQETARMAERVTELESEISALKEDQTSGDGTVSVSYAENLEKTAEKHRNRSEELEVEVSTYTKQNSEITKRVEELEVLLKASKSENERLAESENLTCKELAQRLTQIEEFRRLEAQLRSDLCELEQQAHQAQAEVSDVEENLLSDRQTFETERERWADQVQELQETIDELTRSQGSSEAVEYLKAQHEKEVSSLEEKVAQLDSAWKELNKKAVESEEKVSRMMSDHEQELMKAEKEKSELSAQLLTATAESATEKEMLLKQIAAAAGEANDAKAIACRVPDLEEEIASMKKTLSRDTQRFQDEKSQIMQELEEGKKDIKRLANELEGKCSQLEVEKEALAAAKESLIALKADLDKSATDLEVKVSEISELKNQIVELNGRLEALQRELGNMKDSSEADKDKMKKAVVELRKRLERAGVQQRKVELEGAELRGKLEGEKESLRTELASCKDGAEQYVNELKEYKLRAHALLKAKDTELQELKDMRDSHVEATKHIESLREEADALASEKEAIQVQLEEQDARFTKHLDDLTGDFRAQLDEIGAESAHYRRTCDLATGEAEQWKARALEQENLATSYQQQLSIKMDEVHPIADSHELQGKLDSLQQEYDNLRNASESLQQSKDAEISRLLQLTSDLKAKLLDRPQATSASVLPSAAHTTSETRHIFTGDSVMTHAPDQAPDMFQFSNLLNESEETVSVASNSSKQDWSGGIEGGDAKIFALAQRQAGREEALASALKTNQRLEAEILDLEREVKLREEQESVLKGALRDADRRQRQQDGMLDKSIDMEYLKNTVVKLLETGESEALLPVLARLLRLSSEEEGAVRASLMATKDRQAQEGADASAGGGGILSSLSGWGWGSL